jgi:hypothetical protein
MNIKSFIITMYTLSRLSSKLTCILISIIFTLKHINSYQFQFFLWIKNDFKIKLWLKIRNATYVSKHAISIIENQYIYTLNIGCYLSYWSSKVKNHFLNSYMLSFEWNHTDLKLNYQILSLIYLLLTSIFMI